MDGFDIILQHTGAFVQCRREVSHPVDIPHLGRERDQDNDGAKPNVPRTALNRFSLGHVELLSGIRKLNFGLLKFLYEPKIDGLLHIHVCVVIGAEHN